MRRDEPNLAFTSAGGTWEVRVLDLDFTSVDQHMKVFFQAQMRAGVSARRELAEDGSCTYRVWSPLHRAEGNISLKLLKLGKEQTRIIGTAPDAMKEGLLYFMDQLESWLIPNESKLGNMASMASEKPETNKGGRPRNKDDDWAWRQVNELSRPRNDVYSEWCELIGNRVRMLADPWDSFQKAVRLSRGGGEKPEEKE